MTFTCETGAEEDSVLVDEIDFSVCFERSENQTGIKAPNTVQGGPACIALLVEIDRGPGADVEG